MNKRSLKVNDRVIDDHSECYVIAEIGHNHQGELEKATELFRAAKLAGVQAVKLQKRDNESLFTKAAYERPYENENSYGLTYGKHREFLEFGREEYKVLTQLALDLGLDFFSTAFDIPSADFLMDFDPPAFKIASGDLKNFPLLAHVARFGKPMIISTGGGSLEDIKSTYDHIRPINDRICFLQCTATYPTEACDLNLRVIETLRSEFPEVVVGLSDHYNGISMAPAAYVLGARVIEKHFTLNHTWKGTDHALSLEPIGMHKMVRDLQRLRAALGSPDKACLDIEKPAITKMGKSLFAGRELPAGHTLTRADIAIKSPGGGIPPSEFEVLVGKTLKIPVAADHTFSPNDFAG